MAGLGGRGAGIPQSAGCRDAVPRLLGRPAVHAGVLDAVRLAARSRHRARHDRHAVVGRHHLHGQVLLGARRRQAAFARAAPAAGPAAQLDAARPGRHRGRPAQHGAHESGGAPGRRCVAGAAGGVLVRHPGHRGGCVADRIGADGDAGRDGGRVPARLSHRDDGGQCRRALDCGRPWLGGVLHFDGSLRVHRYRHHARHPRARSSRDQAHPGAGSARQRLARRARRTGRSRCAISARGSSVPS